VVLTRRLRGPRTARGRVAHESMVLLEPDAFLTQLTKILDRSRKSGSVYVTFKRCTPGCKPGSSTDVEPCCLVRAVGPGLKFSAMVSSRSYQRFMQSYGNILKVSLDSLKKREKKKAEKKAGSSKAT